MRVFSPLFLAACLLVCGVRALPSPAPKTVPDVGPLSVATDHMYNLEYKEARQVLESWLAGHPSDLAGLNTLAETMIDAEMLREGLFSSSLYVNNGAALRRLRPSHSPGFARGLEKVLSRAQGLEQDRLQKNPEDEEALYWGGVTHRIRAEFDLVIAQSYMAGFHEGRAAYRYELRAHRVNPADVDPLLMIGIYDYVAASLPWYVKPFALLGGIHGNRAQGLAELQQVSEHGEWDRVDAQATLVIFYRNEKKYPQALAVLEDLGRSFPRDFLVPLEIAGVEELPGDWRAAAGVLDETVERMRAVHSDTAEVLFPQVLFEDGRAHAKLGELGKSLAAYQEAANLTAPPHNAYIYRSGLAAAELCRRLNRPQDARRDYQLVLKAAPQTAEGRAAKRALRSYQ